MSPPSPSPPTHLDTSRATATRLRARWLVLARAGWGACAALIVGLYVLSLPPYAAFLQSPCRGASCSIHWALDAAKLQALQRLGLSPGGYSALVVALNVIFVLVGGSIVAV